MRSLLRIELKKRLKGRFFIACSPLNR